MGQKVELVWVPGHADIFYNEVADKLAKEGSNFFIDNNEKEEISDGTIVKQVKEKMKIRWESMWKRSESGAWTKELLGGRVRQKLMFPKRRCECMTYT